MVEGVHHTETREIPPIVDQTRYTLVGLTIVHRVHVDELTIGIYQWVNKNEIIYLQTLNPIP